MMSVLLAAVILMFWVQPVDSCGPSFSGAVFTLENRPDDMKQFLSGEVGIIQPTWYRKYLALSFRQLNGHSLSPAQTKAILKFQPIQTRDEEALAIWLKERDKHGAQPFKDEDRYYQMYSNCLPAAFLFATETLRQRAKTFGAGSPELKEWLTGQDQVFNHCVGDDPAIPRVLPASANVLLKDDRNYQIAATYFYMGSLDEAQRRFEVIGDDPRSVWQGWGQYLAIRCILRRSGDAEGERFNSKLLQQAEERLRLLLKDPKQKARRNSIQRLLMFVAYRLRPLEQQQALAKAIVFTRESALLPQQLIDYTMLLNRFADQEPDFPGVDPWGANYEKRRDEWRGALYQEEFKKYRRDELTDWILTMQWQTATAKAHALQQWQKSKSLPWLVAALSKAGGADKSVPSLLAAASSVLPSSPGYPTVRFHSVRLLRQSGKADAARILMDETKPYLAGMGASSKNHFRNEQMMLAKDLPEFIRHIHGIPAMVDDWCESKDCQQIYFANKPGSGNPSSSKQEMLPQFDSRSARFLNTKLPLSLLVEMATSTELPENLRHRLALAVWVRAALLDDVENAKRVAPGAIEARPALKALIENFASATDAKTRRFAAVFALLQNPGLRPYVDASFVRDTPLDRIDNYRDNWWCDDMGAQTETTAFEKSYSLEPGKAEERPSFLSNEQIVSADKEFSDLLKDIPSTDFLARTTSEWSRQHLDDPRVPEALHLTVRASRFACGSSKQHGKYSREAFSLLHKHFPKSKWAAKTPHWFD
jgi:hypothetical protein